MKKILAIILALSLILSLAACGNSEKPKSSVSETPSTVGDIIEKEEPKKEISAEKVAVGNTITLDFAEMTVEEAAIADDIKTSIKTGSITYTTGPSRADDKEFVYIRGTIKNTSKSEIQMPEFYGTVEADGYSYDIIDTTIIESDGSSAYSLAPLVTYKYTMYAEIPLELANSISECDVDFSFEDNFKNFSTSEKDYVRPYNYTIKITK